MQRKTAVLVLALGMLAGGVVWWSLYCRGKDCRLNPADILSSAFHKTGNRAEQRWRLPAARQLAAEHNSQITPSAAIAQDLLADAVDRRARARGDQRILYRRRGASIQTLAATAGEKIQVGGAGYRFLPGVRALPASSFPDDDRYAVVDARADYVFFQLGPDEEAPEGTRPVVYNEISKSLGVVTGALSIKWDNPAAKESLALDYQLQPVQSFDDLQVTYFQSSRSDYAGFSLLLSQLKNDKRVVQVDPQILQRTYKAQ